MVLVLAAHELDGDHAHLRRAHPAKPEPYRLDRVSSSVQMCLIALCLHAINAFTQVETITIELHGTGDQTDNDVRRNGQN